MPVSRWDEDVWIHAPRLPLLDKYRGVCRAAVDPLIPSDVHQDELCNRGYAGRRCDHFPHGSADAARFSVVADRGSSLSLVYILEKDHLPDQHGKLEYWIAESRLEGEGTSLLHAQARAFVQGYLRRVRPPTETAAPSLREVERPLRRTSF
jgi:hypothetical protein